jgi:hypothetical protein
MRPLATFIGPEAGPGWSTNPRPDPARDYCARIATTISAKLV